MAQAVMTGQAGEGTAKRVVRRHGLMVRITHWINAVAIAFMLFSGLQIFNAHPALYWGKASRFDSPWLSMRQEGERGITRIGDWKLDTTGVLGYSKYGNRWEARGFPAWATLPSLRNLAAGRNWHLFFAWIFAINLLVYLASGLIGRHLVRDVLPSGRDLRHVGKDLVDHLKLNWPKGEEAARYQALQRIAYSGIVFIVLPLIILSGLAMSPSLNASMPWILDILGGRQSARSIHFICMALIVLFFIVHIVMVFLSGPLNQLRGMITGRYVIREERP